MHLFVQKVSFSRKDRKETKKTVDITAITWYETDCDIVLETIIIIEVVKFRYCAFNEKNWCASIQNHRHDNDFAITKMIAQRSYRAI